MNKEKSPILENGVPSRSRSSLDNDSSSFNLPDVPDVDTTSIRLVKRVVGLVFSILFVMALIAAVVSYFVKIDLGVDVTGSLLPSERQTVRSLQSGTITKVWVAAGDTVASGQTLASIDSLVLKEQLLDLRSRYQSTLLRHHRELENDSLEARELHNARRKAESQLIRAEATLREEFARNGYDVSTSIDSFIETHTPGTHIAIDRAYADVINARAELGDISIRSDRDTMNVFARQERLIEIRNLREQIRLVSAQRERLEITAPRSGIVLTNRPHELEGTAVQSGEDIFVIGSPSQWVAEFFVNETEVSEITAGDPVRLELNAHPHRNARLVQGTVRSVTISPVSQQAQGAVNLSGSFQSPALDPASSAGEYRVTASLDSDNLRKFDDIDLRTGYSVEGKIITRSGRIMHLIWEYLFTESLR